jgi:hypothetical protein
MKNWLLGLVSSQDADFQLIFVYDFKVGKWVFVVLLAKATRERKGKKKGVHLAEFVSFSKLENWNEIRVTKLYITFIISNYQFVLFY